MQVSVIGRVVKAGLVKTSSEPSALEIVTSVIPCELSCGPQSTSFIHVPRNCFSLLVLSRPPLSLCTVPPSVCRATALAVCYGTGLLWSRATLQAL